MAERRCPYCGELVPSTSITCPRCYKKIPVEPERRADDYRMTDESPRKERGFSRKLALALNVVPGFFGILGLGQIYRDWRQTRGYVFLALGLLLFWGAALILLNVMPILSSVVALPLLIIYVLLYIGAAADLVMSMIFHVRI